MTSASLALLLALQAPAEAAPAAWFDPDEVAARSEVFRTAAEALAPRFEEVQGQLAKLGRGLEALDANLALHGAVAPEELAGWAATSRRTITGQYLQVQRHVDLVQEDMAATFGGALQRQLHALEGEFAIRECAERGLGAMLGPNRASGGGGGSCEGTELNDRLAASLDEDPRLAAAAAEIAEVPWPGIGIDPRTEPAVALTGTASWIDAHRLSRTFADAALDRRREALEDALAPIEEGLEAGDAEAVARGQQLRARYEAGLAEDGARLRAALAAALDRAGKKGAPPSLGLCLVPPELGGCTGEEVTGEVIALLQEDRRFLKDLGELRE